MKKIFVFILLITGITFSKAKEIKLYFQNFERMTSYDDGTIKPIYFINFDTLNIDKKIYPIILPNLKNVKDTAFTKIFFTGWQDSPFPRQSLLLIANYKSDSVLIWADLNNNLNFVDDSAFFYISKTNPYIKIGFPNSQNPKCKFIYKISKTVYSDSVGKKNFNDYFYNDDSKKGFITTNCDYWLTFQRLNILSCDTIIDGTKVQIGLMDWNCNGTYNDIDTVTKIHWNSDRILIGKYGSEIISYHPSDGAVILPNKLLNINNHYFQITAIDEEGKYIKIKPTDKKPDLLQVGDNVPDFKFSLLNGQKTSFTTQIVKGKYNLIDLWSIGCKGCVLAIPILKRLDSLYSKKLNIISLHYWQTDRNYIQKYIKKKKVSWINGILTAEIVNQLRSSGGIPYYVLIDPKGKIFQFNTNLKKVEKILKLNN